jgi:hypothetical protein
LRLPLGSGRDDTGRGLRPPAKFGGGDSEGGGGGDDGDGLRPRRRVIENKLSKCPHDLASG